MIGHDYTCIDSLEGNQNQKQYLLLKRDTRGRGWEKYSLLFNFLHWFNFHTFYLVLILNTLRKQIFEGLLCDKYVQ